MQAVVALLSAVALALAPVAARAQQEPVINKLGDSIPITGNSKGTVYTYSFTLNHFTAENGRLFAVGTLSGGNLPSTAEVSIPVRAGGEVGGGGGNGGNGENNGAAPGGFGGGSGALERGTFTKDAVFQTSSTPVIVLAQQAQCPILSLTLGPLHLNLLGLVIDLNQVVLNINAQPGPGNLLGNLLCAVVNLLNNNPLPGNLAASIAAILNAILAAL